jgi:hypothetical protein
MTRGDNDASVVFPRREVCLMQCLEVGAIVGEQRSVPTRGKGQLFVVGRVWLVR